MRNKKQLTFGALLSYAAVLLNIATGVFCTPWIIRTLGSDQYALYSLALSVINLFLMDFGLGSAITKYLSEFYALEQYDKVQYFLGIVYKVFLVISAIIAIIFFAFYFVIDIIYVKLTVAELVVFKRLFIFVAAYSILSFSFSPLNGVLMANEKFIEIKLCNLGQKALSLILIIMFLWLGKDVYWLVLAHAVSNVLFCGTKYYLVSIKNGIKANYAVWDTTAARELFRFSMWSTVKNIAHRCIFNIMPTIIAMFIDSQSVTIFSLAATFEGYVFVLADAINGMFMPQITRIVVREKNPRQLESLMIKVGRYHILTIGLLFIGFICIGKNFVDLWIGRGFDQVYICAILLILPSLIDIPQQVAKNAMIAQNMMKMQAIIYIGMAVSNILLSVLLIPVFGIFGAGLSICCSYLLRTIGLNFIYRQKLSIRLKAFFMAVYGRWSVVAAATFLLGLYINRYLPIEGWMGILVKGISITFVYVLLYVVVCVDSQNRSRFMKKLRLRNRC